MPIHLSERDVASEVSGLSSALIVPCNMCPAVIVAVEKKQPFMRFFRSPLKSVPFEQYIRSLRCHLREHGVDTEVFGSSLYHHWFLCMWTSGRRKKLRERAKRHEAVIVLGCESAAETVRDSVQSTDCKVIQGMKVTGFMNAKLKFHWPCNISFDDCKIIPMS